MSNMTELTHIHSPESEMDIGIDDLIAKIVEGTATPADRVRFTELVANRTRMMRPPGRYELRRKYA